MVKWASDRLDHSHKTIAEAEQALQKLQPVFLKNMCRIENSLGRTEKKAVDTLNKAASTYVTASRKIQKAKVALEENKAYIEHFVDPLDRLADCVHTPETKIVDPGFVFIVEGCEHDAYWTLEEFEKKNHKDDQEEET